MSDFILNAKNVFKTYHMGKVKVEALKNINLEVKKGEFVTVAGQSGSGKSTMLNILGLIDMPDSGELIINGNSIYTEADYAVLKKMQKTQRISKKLDKKVTRMRRELIGFIFQAFNLIPVLNVYENIEYPLLFNKKKKTGKKEIEWINYLIERVGLTGWKKHKPSELSGGQQQRAAVARALAAKPALVFADEPTGNLDSNTGTQILDLMHEVNKEFKTAFIFSSHDEKIINTSKHIVRLLDGNIVENNLI